MNILVTGSSRGIGREFVEQYLDDSKVEKVWAVTQNPSALAALIESHSGRLHVISASLDKDESIVRLRDALRGHTLDLLINNAGTYITEPSQFSEVKFETLEKTFSVNVGTAFRATQACLDSLKRSKSPIVVQVSSLMGSIADNASGGSYGYRISKVALNMFNKSFSVDHPGITAVVVHPGWVKTDMGGTQAPTLPQESVAGLRKKIATLTLKESGCFYDYQGDELPW
jgi:NAD(P)-dependent dehydrogenase (short-subunit alcohol dehydrogenase family)